MESEMEKQKRKGTLRAVVRGAWELYAMYKLNKLLSEEGKLEEKAPHDEADSALTKVAVAEGAKVGAKLAGAAVGAASAAAATAVATAAAAAVPATTLTIGSTFGIFVAEGVATAVAGAHVPLLAALVLNPVTGPVILGGMVVGGAVAGHKIARRAIRRPRKDEVRGRTGAEPKQVPSD